MNIVVHSVMPVLLTLLAMLSVGFLKTGAADVGGNGDAELRSAFYAAVHRNVLPENEGLFNWWSASEADWTFEAAASGRRWAVSVPVDGAVEMWEFSAPLYGLPVASPRNAGALLTAIDLFCDGRADPTAACQGYVQSLGALTE